MESVLLDLAGHPRSPATMPGYHRGRPPRNKRERYPRRPANDLRQRTPAWRAARRTSADCAALLFISAGLEGPSVRPARRVADVWRADLLARGELLLVEQE